MMEIIFQGRLSSEETVESLESVIRLFKDRYHISQFREVHLSVTMVSEQGEDVELIDSETQQAFRVFEVYREGYELTKSHGRPALKLVIDNTR